MKKFETFLQENNEEKNRTILTKQILGRKSEYHYFPYLYIFEEFDNASSIFRCLVP